ncbi:MAG: TfoX/Sxy family protein [Paracoccaceae bacterium]|nr:TfoX/Sxy family protein [Paracoccaceae bacterium]
MSGTPISTIRNLGPAMQDAFERAGIPDAETLRALGADAAYAKLLANGARPHFIGYYVLHMALQGRPWNDCKGKEKDALRKNFDALKAGVALDGPSPDLQAFLRDIGLTPPR